VNALEAKCGGLLYWPGPDEPFPGAHGSGWDEWWRAWFNACEKVRKLIVTLPHPGDPPPPVQPVEIVNDAVPVRMTPATAPESPQDQAGKKEESPQARNSLKKVKLGWQVTYKGETETVPDLKGWSVLKVLLGSPHKVVNSLELEGTPQERVPPRQADDTYVDREALRSYRKRLQEIGNELPKLYAKAAAGDSESEEKAVELETEREQIEEHIRESTRPGRKGKAQKPRRDSHDNLAAKAADRIKASLKAVREQLQNDHPGMTHLAEHIHDYVSRKGDSYVYVPNPPDLTKTGEGSPMRCARLPRCQGRPTPAKEP
jgi:hypothetical protein